jgi:hypothetical protein
MPKKVKIKDVRKPNGGRKLWSNTPQNPISEPKNKALRKFII